MTDKASPDYDRLAPGESPLYPALKFHFDNRQAIADSDLCQHKRN